MAIVSSISRVPATSPPAPARARRRKSRRVRGSGSILYRGEPCRAHGDTVRAPLMPANVRRVRMAKERGSANGRGGASARVADKGPSAARAADPALARYDRAELLRLLEQMQLIRHFEERAAEQYTRARVGGYIHLNVGEEASVVGAIAALRPGDR